MKKRTHIPAETPAELLADLRNLVVEAETLLQSSVTEHSEEALAALRARVSAAQDRLAALYDCTKKKVSDGARYADETIRENPYQSLAVALGLGIVVGVLVGRRSK